MVLGDDAIYEFSPCLASIENKLLVSWRDHHERQQTDMVDKTFVVFFTPSHLLFLPPLEPATDLLVFSAKEVIALNKGGRLVVSNRLRIECCKGRFGETQVINGIEQVGLSLSVESDEAVKFIRKLEIGFCDILEIEYVERT